MNSADDRHKILEWIMYIATYLCVISSISHARLRDWHLIHRVGRTGAMHLCMDGRYAQE